MIATCNQTSSSFVFSLFVSIHSPPPTAILSVTGNAAVLVISARRPTPLKGPELLVVNLAVTDLGMALSMYPLSIASAFNHGWLGGDASCLYYGVMGMVFSVASIMSLTTLGMVRYLVNGNPPETGGCSQCSVRCDGGDQVKLTVVLVMGLLNRSEDERITVPSPISSPAVMRFTSLKVWFYILLCQLSVGFRWVLGPIQLLLRLQPFSA